MPEKPQHIHPNTVRAALGSATLLHSFLLPKAPPEAPQPQQTAPQQAEPQETKETPKEEAKENVGEKLAEFQTQMMTQLDSIRQELKADNQREMDTLKKTITDALQS